MKSKLFFCISMLVMMMCIMSSCNATSNDGGVIHTHAYGDWQTVTPATCTETGIKKRFCSCGQEETETIAALGHKFGGWKTELTATCQSTGIDAQYCSTCGYKNSQVTYGEHVLNSNNVCKYCNKTYINMTDAEKQKADEVHYINNRKVEYDKNNDWFKFTFALLDEDEYKLKVPTLVDLRMENDNGVVVYEKTILVKVSDYKNNLATIYIKSSEIKDDYEEGGDLYYKVYNPGYFSFDEYSLSLYDLPLKAANLNIPNIPATFSKYDYKGYTETTVRIDTITYEMSGTIMYVYFSGEKLYDENGNSYSRKCSVGYKIYDSEGYVVKTGTLYTEGLKVGDKFKNERISFSATVGETYTLELLDIG